MSIFKAYDVRGVVPDQLGPKDAYRVGRAVTRQLGARQLVVGRDARKSSPELAGELVRGIREEGADVIDIGLVATPMLYFAVDALGADGGVMVTASHNPAQYNGFKICREHAIPVGEASGLREIEKLAANVADEPPAARPGGLRRADVTDRYVDHVLAVGEQRPRLHVAIDCGNGMAGVALEPLLARLPLRVEKLYFEPDCTFPNHPADPLHVENLADVSRAVRETGADFGVAFDGDADRAIFVDERGERVLYDLRSSWATAEEIRAAGGVPEMCRVGHSFVKAAMREKDALFAGELSGHFYFRFSPTLVADDGIAALVAMLDVLGRERRPLSALIAPLRRYFASGEVSRRVGDPQAILAELAREHAGAPERSHMDGLLVRYDDWWFNMRPSNTEPLLRLNVEAKTEARMKSERDRLLAKMV
jgi:phosphomannomutase